MPPVTKYPQGRHPRYCSSTCRGAATWARHRERQAQDDIARLDAAFAAEAPREVRPFSWWVTQAEAITETCPKCEGPVEGVYVPPSQANMGECAVVAHCRICGSERMVIAGRAGVPYGTEPVLTPTEQAVQQERSRRGRYAVRQRAWRPPRVAGGQGKTRDNKGRWKERDAQR